MYHKKLIINGETYPMETVIPGEGEPDASTEGNVGQLYFDTEAEAYWTCKGKEDDDYIWFPLPLDEVIINDDAKAGTKIRLETTDDEVELAEMSDLNEVVVIDEEAGEATKIRIELTDEEVELAEESEVKALETILTPPAADGTYILKATVNGDTVTYSWVAEN